MSNVFAVARSPFHALLWLLLITFSGSAQADYPPGQLELSLQIEHNETGWQYASETLTSKSSILGVQLQETLAPRLRGRLHAGYLDLSQPGNTLAAARVTTGYYAG